jgi:hypothetical protein
MGWGLSDGLSFESLVEDRLNESPGAGAPRVEILNFACGGYGAFQQLFVLESKAARYSPDAAFWVMNSVEEQWLLNHLSAVLSQGVASPYTVIDDVAARAGVERNMTRAEIEARLKPFAWELLSRAVEHFISHCASRGYKAYLIFRPSPETSDPLEKKRDAEFLARLRATAELGHASLLDLSSAFDELGPRESMALSLLDDHLSARGHELLAKELYRQLTTSLERSLWVDGEDGAGDAVD